MYYPESSQVLMGLLPFLRGHDEHLDFLSPVFWILLSRGRTKQMSKLSCYYSIFCVVGSLLGTFHSSPYFWFSYLFHYFLFENVSLLFCLLLEMKYSVFTVSADICQVYEIIEIIYLYHNYWSGGNCRISGRGKRVSVPLICLIVKMKIIICGFFFASVVILTFHTSCVRMLLLRWS